MNENLTKLQDLLERIARFTPAQAKIFGLLLEHAGEEPDITEGEDRADALPPADFFTVGSNYGRLQPQPMGSFEKKALVTYQRAQLNGGEGGE